MTRLLRILDVVALMADKPGAGLVRGQVGTVVEALDRSTYEVEFVDESGETYCLVPVPSGELLVLHHGPVRAA